MTLAIDRRGPVGVLLTLRGPVPCKKSKYRRGRNGGLYLDAATRKAMDDLTLQARAQWKREPVEHPEVTVWFWWPHLRADRDGKLATLLDVLQKAGVIRNDNAAHFNGRLLVEPVRLSDEERTEILIAKQDVEDLLL